MPRVKKEDYNAYMKEYMNSYQKKKKTLNKLEHPVKDFDGTQAPVLDLQSDEVKQALEMGKEVFKDPKTGKPDKIFEYIEKGAKYMPLVMKFIEGFMTNMQTFNQQQQQQSAKQAPAIQPPPGWDGMGAMEKLKYKYAKPGWYEAGLKWDEYKETGVINPEINIGYVDSSYTPNRRPAAQSLDDTPCSLLELGKKYPDPPLLKDEYEAPAQLHDPKLEEVIKEKKDKKGAVMDKKVELQDNKSSDEVIKALQQDNARYLQMAIKFLGAQSLEEFQKNIEDLEGLYKKYEPMMELLPLQLREMINNSSDEELIKIFEEACPDKYSWSKENNKLEAIKTLFGTIKKRIK